MSTKKKGILVPDVGWCKHLRSHRSTPFGNFWHRHRMAEHRELREQIEEMLDDELTNVKTQEKKVEEKR
jgi:hypothetical protein